MQTASSPTRAPNLLILGNDATEVIRASRRTLETELDEGEHVIRSTVFDELTGAQ